MYITIGLYKPSNTSTRLYTHMYIHSIHTTTDESIINCTTIS